jgi:hypothetical protein
MMTRRHWILAACVLFASALVIYALAKGSAQRPSLALALLLPDRVPLDDPYVSAWVDAAREEGIRLEPLTANAFLRPTLGAPKQYAGLILPDTVHTVMNEALVAGIHRYVRQGGKLMLVFDAGTLLLPNRTYAKRKSLFSDLAGVDYVLYDDLKDSAIVKSQVFGLKTAFQSLRIPPGKYFGDGGFPQNPAETDAEGRQANESSLFAYAYDRVDYPHFVTRGAFSGTPLLYGKGREIVAGTNRFHDGWTFFVNLPLGYLKTRTDGLLLHGCLRYFAVDVVRLPYLSIAPEGRGGLVMNWHIDSNAALPALKKLKKTRIFEQGPYSIHVTAGPDRDQPGDGLGLDIGGNASAREWLDFFARRGDAIGSHGGWIHNYFGYGVNDTNRNDFEPYLSKNKAAIERITGLPVTEYSAPDGNHPLWVTEWLDEHDIKAYYFVGDMGMGPTKPYRNDRKQPGKAWAFPVLSMGKYAAFEEMHADGIDDGIVARWLTETTDFTADEQVIRLIYFHPPGILQYRSVVDQWLTYTQKLSREGRFSWYTMTDVAKFMDERNEVVWDIHLSSEGEATFQASHPTSLARQSWRLPRSRFGRPVVVEGRAEIVEDGRFWLVRASGEQRLRLRMSESQGPASQAGLFAFNR